jgi:hypothetical protein
MQELAKLEREARSKADDAREIGKQAKFRNPTAIRFHSERADRFQELRTGKAPPHPFDLLAKPRPVGNSPDQTSLR